MIELEQHQHAQIEAAQAKRVENLLALSSVNSGSSNLAGLGTTLEMLLDLAQPLGASLEVQDLDPIETLTDQGEVVEMAVGQLATLTQRPEASRQMLLVGHYDTVFTVESTFQTPEWTTGGVLRGPGVADMKGGILVMLDALYALETSKQAADVGWTVLFNPDEELGSLASAPALAAAAKSNDLGLVFEPSFPDGNLAGQRKGSGTFRIITRGVSAHAGRDHHLGHNAIAALARLTASLDDLNGAWADTTINVGYVHGGGPSNIVPDLAVLTLNVRVPDATTAKAVTESIKSLAKSYAGDDISIEVDGFFSRPPKELTPEIEGLLRHAQTAGTSLGLDLSWHPTGGVSDGNNLAAAGLPNIDNLGVHGGAIHSGDEFVYVESMSKRAALAATMMVSFAAGELDETLSL